MDPLEQLVWCLDLYKQDSNIFLELQAIRDESPKYSAAIKENDDVELANLERELNARFALIKACNKRSREQQQSTQKNIDNIIADLITLKRNKEDELRKIGDNFKKYAGGSQEVVDGLKSLFDFVNEEKLKWQEFANDKWNRSAGNFLLTIQMIVMCTRFRKGLRRVLSETFYILWSYILCTLVVDAVRRRLKNRSIR